MNHSILLRWGYIPLWLLLTITVFFHAPLPIDETRYLSVAWEMWQRGDFLVPYINGHTYSHKPPLLFWLMQASWAIFGMNEFTPRLVGPVCGLLNLWLVRYLAKRLWPEQPAIALIAPWVLLSTLLWTLFASSTMFDTLQTNCVLLAMLGMVEVTLNQRVKGWALVALGIGLGILAKGPVVFVHVLPTALAVFYWQRSQFKRGWFVGLLLATLAGSALALAWALPAAYQGGEEYGNAILWHQTADRAVSTKIHARGVHWYLMFLPLLIFPWVAWPKLWQQIRGNACWHESATRLCLVWFLATFVVLSVVPSKQLHYLIPILPAFALLVSRLLTPMPNTSLAGELVVPVLIELIAVVLIALPFIPSKLYWIQHMQVGWGIAVLVIGSALMAYTLWRRQLSIVATTVSVIVAVSIGLVAFFDYSDPAYDLTAAAQKIGEFQAQGKDYVFVGDYQGQFQFLGQLTQPLPVIDSKLLEQWRSEHPEGIWIALEHEPAQQAWYQQLHREHWLIFRKSQD